MARGPEKSIAAPTKKCRRDNGVVAVSGPVAYLCRTKCSFMTIYRSFILGHGPSQKGLRIERKTFHKSIVITIGKRSTTLQKASKRSKKLSFVPIGDSFLSGKLSFSNIICYTIGPNSDGDLRNEAHNRRF